jgi:hypothetical protein
MRAGNLERIEKLDRVARHGSSRMQQRRGAGVSDPARIEQDQWDAGKDCPRLTTPWLTYIAFSTWLANRQSSQRELERAGLCRSELQAQLNGLTLLGSN